MLAAGMFMGPMTAKAVLVLFLAGAVAAGPALAGGKQGRSAGSPTRFSAGPNAHPGGPARFSGTRRVHRGAGRHFFGPRLGVFVAAPLFWPWYSFPPPYYYPPVVAAPYAPTQYIEQELAPVAPSQPSAYWYYCAEDQSYYPYVQQCPGGWQLVAPQPPPQ